VWSFYAIVTKLDDVYEVTMTAAVRQVLSHLRVVVNLGLGSSTAVLACVGLNGFYAQLIFWMLVPPFLISAIVVKSLAFLLWQRSFSHDALVDDALPLILAALFLLYPMVANVAFEAFSCCALRTQQPRPWSDARTAASVSTVCRTQTTSLTMAAAI
jgi:hypothetical protein